MGCNGRHRVRYRRGDLRHSAAAALLQAAIDHGFSAALRIDNTSADGWVGIGEANLQLGRLHAGESAAVAVCVGPMSQRPLAVSIRR